MHDLGPDQHVQAARDADGHSYVDTSPQHDAGERHEAGLPDALDLRLGRVLSSGHVDAKIVADQLEDHFTQPVAHGPAPALAIDVSEQLGYKHEHRPHRHGRAGLVSARRLDRRDVCADRLAVTLHLVRRDEERLVLI